MYDYRFMFKGYPGNYRKGKVINLKKFKDKKNLFTVHAGTKKVEENILSNGGRVLNVVCKGKNFRQIGENIIKLIKKLIGEMVFIEKILGGGLYEDHENNKWKT